MSVTVEPASGPVVIVPDTVDELVTDPGWLAECDQVRAALYREWLPGCRGAWRDRLDVVLGAVR